MRKGDQVVLTVSKGPASLTVPTVTGMTLTDAIAVAKASGLTITVVEYVVSEDVEADQVLRQVPEAGTACEPGDIVQVTVSGGLAEVPNTYGETLADAKAALTSNGLTVASTVTYVDTTDTSLHGLVAGQSPEAGAQVIQGTTVYLTIWQVPGMNSRAQVTLDLPERDTDLNVRVTLVIDDTEVTTWSGTVGADELRHPTVTLSAQLPGSYVYKVYCDGSFAYQSTAALE